MILQLTKSFLKVEFEGRLYKIHGEMLVHSFLIYKEFIEYWDQSEGEVKESLIEPLIAHITEEANKINEKISFM